MESKNKIDLKTRIFSSKFFLFLILLVFIGMVLSVANVSYNRHLIAKELDALKSEIEKMKSDNKDLSKMIEYYSSQEFWEKEARQKFNLKKEGENVIMVPKN